MVHLWGCIIRISIDNSGLASSVEARTRVSCSRARSWSRSGGGAAAPDARASCGLRDPGAGPRGRLAASDHATLQRRTPRFVESQLIRYPTPRCTRAEYRIKAQRSTTVSTLRTPSRSRTRALEPRVPGSRVPPGRSTRASGDPRRFDRPPPYSIEHNMDIGAVLKGQTPLADSLSHTPFHSNCERHYH